MDQLLASLTSTCDPLTDVVRRIRTERDAVVALVTDPVRTSVWFAALIGPVIQALPPSDPWRALTVRLPDGAQVPSAEVLANDPGAPVLTGPGAVGPTGAAFGTVDVLLDLIPRGADDIADDIALAGLDADLPLPSAYLLAAASESADAAALAVECIRVSRLSPGDGGFTVPNVWLELFGHPDTGGGRSAAEPEGFYVLSSALRWAMVRYRTYTGDMSVSAELPQLGLEVEQWIGSADLSAVDLDEQEPVWAAALARALAAAGQQPPLRAVPIPPGAYEDFRIA